jgi:hypothetical protein
VVFRVLVHDVNSDFFQVAERQTLFEFTPAIEKKLSYLVAGRVVEAHDLSLRLIIFGGK